MSSCYILVHGCWHAAWCWSRITPILASKHRVFAPDLAGHGNNKSFAGSPNLNTYVEQICSMIDSAREKVILIGHSFGGVVISQAAEYCSEKVESLIYISGFIPSDRQSFFDLVSGLDHSNEALKVKIDKQRSVMELDPETVREGLYHDCPEEEWDVIKGKLSPEPLRPLGQPVSLSKSSFGSLPKFYIECLYDKALNVGMQRKMSENAGCSVVSVGSSHSPFFSCPENLASVIFSLELCKSSNMFRYNCIHR